MQFNVFSIFTRLYAFLHKKMGEERNKTYLVSIVICKCIYESIFACLQKETMDE